MAVAEDWPNPGVPPRVDGHYVTLQYGGYDWVLLHGNSETAYRKFVPISRSTWDAVERYQSGAPGGRTGGLATGYSSVWRRLELGPQRPQRPAARRSWADLSPQTKRGYRSPIRKALGGRPTEQQIAQYYETAPDLRAVRRKPGLSQIAPSDQQVRLGRQRAGAPEPYLILWRQR